MKSIAFEVLEGGMDRMMGQTNIHNRRNFLKYSAAALAFPVVGVGALKWSNIWFAPKDAKPSSGRWKTTLVSDNEPGEPLIVSGVIYGPDGKTPFEGATLWVYQTDATGRYSTSGGDNRYTRLHGQMTTGEDGRYEFRTIKPSSYPGRTVPAHIHAYVSGPGFPEYWIDEYLFEGDALITLEARRKLKGKGTRFFSILTLTRDNRGVLHGERDIRMERCTDNCTRK